MKNIILKISKWFLSAYENSDIRIKKRATIFFWVILMTFFVYLVYIVFFILFSPPSYFKMILTYIVFVAIYVTSLLLLKTGRYKTTYIFYAVAYLSVFSFYVMFIHEDKSYSSIYWITLVCILVQLQFSLFALDKSKINLFILVYSLSFVTFVFYFRKLVYPRYPIEDWERDGFGCLIYISLFYIVAHLANWITSSTLDEVYKKKEDLEKQVDERTSELKKAKEEIEKLSEQKTNLFINLTHDTKTPLTLINNYLEKFMKENKFRSNDLEIIKRNLDKITRDITNFFEMEKMNRGKIIFKEGESVSFSEVLTDKAVLYKNQALKKNISLISEIDDNINIHIDPPALDKLINNLLDNSLKFTEENGIVTVSLHIVEGIGYFSVSDNGIGISKEDREHIFEAYYQAQMVKKNSQGIGLGLNIVKYIADQFNLKIDIRSEINKGTEFIISFFPETKGNTPDYSFHKPIDISSDLINADVYITGRNNILLVEDNVDLLNFISGNISQGYNVFHANNGRTALDKLSAVPKPDLIISDIMMDQMDGYEFYNEMLSSFDYKDVPFIFISARMNMEDKLQGLSFGAVDYITKPFSMDELNAKINSLINNKKAQIEIIKDSISRLLYNIPQKNENVTNYTKLNYRFNEYKISEKEKEVLLMLLNDLEYKEMAKKIGISINTIRAHVKSIYLKCNVNSKYSLMKIFK